MAARLVLASSSPRRSALLRAAGIEFVPGLPGPEPEAAGTPEQLAMARARSKACGGVRPADCALPLLGVDTVVDVDGRELGKPQDRDAAAAMLRRLAGRLHRVHTAHCLFDPGRGVRSEELASATVACRDVAAVELERYLDSGDWRGKAGSYGIQDGTQMFLRVVEGAFDTVVGLHVAAVRRLLRAVLP